MTIEAELSGDGDGRQLASRLAETYALNPTVEAVVLSGSRTSGQGDATSDIDLYVYSRQPISIEQRRRVAAGARRAEIGNEFWEPGDEWIDEATGISADVMFRDCLWIEEQLDRVLKHHQASVGYSTCFWYNVLHSEILLIVQDGLRVCRNGRGGHIRRSCGRRSSQRIFRFCETTCRRTFIRSSSRFRGET